MTGFSQIETLNETQIFELWKLYQNEWWTNTRTLEDTQTMLNHTDINIALLENESGKMAAYCRLLTDYIYKAVLMDVIVAPEYRKAGLGTQLMNAAVNHPKLAKVSTIDLWCLEEMIPFYERWQFTNQLDKVRFMRRQHNQNKSI